MLKVNRRRRFAEFRKKLRRRGSGTCTYYLRPPFRMCAEVAARWKQTDRGGSKLMIIDSRSVERSFSEPREPPTNHYGVRWAIHAWGMQKSPSNAKPRTGECGQHEKANLKFCFLLAIDLLSRKHFPASYR